VSKEIFKIEQLDDKVQIITKDGATFTGDLLVGADGVHSRTRAEMWTIAEAEDPDYGTKQLPNCMFSFCPKPTLYMNLPHFSNYLYVPMHVRHR
jgi:2-polyprenyl-6-methoxyphenol hydroxylase-like FAD-dependent oxidoreductase